MQQNDCFEKHWTENFDEKIPDSKKIVAKRFLKPVFKAVSSSENIYILDCGCGDGVHSEVIEENCGSLGSSLFVGMDVSISALRIASQRKRENRAFICGDIGQMPFFSNTFDIAFSYGVLAYTQDPAKSFFELCRVVKTGGLVGIWMSPRKEGIGGWIFRSVRKICQAVGPFGTKVIAHITVPFLVFLPTNSKVHLFNASWRQCVEVVLVNISPKKLYFPRQEEIISWFKKENIYIVSQDENDPIMIWGQKK